MSNMIFQQPYPMGHVQGFNQITKRMMTDAERQLPVGVYRGVQRAARGISVVCLDLFLMNAYVTSRAGSIQKAVDPAPKPPNVRGDARVPKGVG